MVAVSADFEKVDIIAILYCKTGVLQCFDDTVGQYFPSILYWTYNMVEQTGLGVTLRDVTFFHSTNILQISLPPKPQLRSNSSCIVLYRESSGRRGD